MTLFGVWSASACSACTMAMPASIIVASWRVNTTRSASATLPPLVWPRLAIFSWMDNHQQVAVEQRGDGGLLGGGLDGVADFAAGGRFSGGVGK
jgi:hypothetical protein